MTGLQADADAAGLITWEVSVDCTIARAHRHAAGARTRPQDLKELPGGVVDEPEGARPGSAPTRHTDPAPTASTCADAVSAARSRKADQIRHRKHGQPGGPTARVLRDGLPAATRCRVRHQPIQNATAPSPPDTTNSPSATKLSSRSPP